MAIIINLFENSKLVISLKADDALQQTKILHVTEKYQDRVKNLITNGIHDLIQNVNPQDETPENFIVMVAMRLVSHYPELSWKVSNY